MKKKVEKSIETKLSELRDGIQNKIVGLDLFKDVPAYALASIAVKAICSAVEFHSDVEALTEDEEPACPNEEMENKVCCVREDGTEIPEGVAMIAHFLSDISGKPVHVKVMRKGEWKHTNEKPKKSRKFREKRRKDAPQKSNKINPPF